MGGSRPDGTRGLAVGAVAVGTAALGAWVAGLVGEVVGTAVVAGPGVELVGGVVLSCPAMFGGQQEKEKD